MALRLPTLAATLISLALAAPGVSASILDASGDDNGQGSISVSLDGNIITVEKSYDSTGSMFVNFEQDDDGSFHLVETITNNTGVTWTDFHWTLTGETSGTFDWDSVGTEPGFPFATFETSNNNTEVEVFGGTVADGESFEIGLSGLLEGASEGSHILHVEQYPTFQAQAPEPATVGLLALGLLGVGAVRRRK